MNHINLIVEGTIDEEKEKQISKFARIKHRLPMINSYVIEISEGDVKRLSGLGCIKAVHQNASITAQMYNARRVIHADRAHARGLTGRGVTVAILDTGVSPVDDLTRPRNRIVAFKDIIKGKPEPYDDNGHGTHVTGIAAGNGICSDGRYAGIAPECEIVSIKILDESGKGGASDVLAGLQWMMDNRKRYGIRVANLSIGTRDIGYKDPLVRAVEAAWDAGIVMIIAAGNNGPGKSTVTSPGISRKVITVGASDDNKKVQIWGDTIENFSGRGPTSDCIIKPDVLAPGADIISCLSPNFKCGAESGDSSKVVSLHYLQMSGTSMSTPILTGSIALLLQKYPDLYPDDVKYLLKSSTVNLNYSQNQQGWGLIDLDKLVSDREVRHVR